MLRVILVDDESLARRGLRELLAAYPQIQVVAEAARVSEAAKIIACEQPDAVFLDIRMPGDDGFSLLTALEIRPKVIFVTAHSEHAVRAFEVQAMDYLLKPVRPDRLADAVSRLTAACARQPESTAYAPADKICLRTPQRTVIASLADVAALEADGDFTRFHIVGEPILLINRTLVSYEEVLPSPPFVRLSRFLMVNLDCVNSISRLSRDAASLRIRGISRQFDLGRRAIARLKSNMT